MKAGVFQIPGTTEVITKSTHSVIRRAYVFTWFIGVQSEKTVGEAQQSNYTG